MLLNYGVGEDSWDFLGLQGDPTSPKGNFLKEISPEYSLEGLMLSWNSNLLATWWEELTHWKRPWSWERLKVGGEGDNRGWDGWMASLTQWAWVWASSGSWWCTGKPGVLQTMGSQKIGHDWATNLNYTEKSSNPPLQEGLVVWFWSESQCLRARRTSDISSSPNLRVWEQERLWRV